jgi:T5SS/PEP-CTERM-associated repeat protein
MSRHALFRTTILSGAALAAVALPAQACDVTYSGPQETTLNSNLAGSVCLSQGYHLTVTGNGTPRIDGSLTLGPDAGLDRSRLGVGNGGTLTVTGTTVAGLNGAETAIGITDGGTMLADVLEIGKIASSVGNSVTVDGPASALEITSGFLGITVGIASTDNRLTISNGGSVRSSSNSLGFLIGADGNAAIVTGAGSSWTSIRTEVGVRGNNNAISILDGGTMSTTSISLGLLRSANANQLAISGANSLLSVTQGDLIIGRSGSDNTLTVENGGKVTAAAGLVLGLGSGGNRAEIRGGGAGGVETRLTSRSLTVGGNGNGNSVSVAAGGKLDTQGDALIGNALAQGNSVSVVGEGSRWSVAGDLSINTPGNSMATSSAALSAQSVDDANRLIIDDGGQLQVAGDMAVSGTGMLTLGPRANLAAGSLSLSSDTQTTLVADGESGPAIAVTNQAALGGGLTVKIETANLRNSSTLLTAGSITGSYDAFSLVPAFESPLAAGALSSSLDYSATEVTVRFTANIGHDQKLSGNPSSVAAAINESFNAGGVLPASFVPIFGLSGDALSTALGGLAGEAGATGGAQSVMRANTLFLGSMTDAGLARQPQADRVSATASGEANIIPTADAPLAASGWSAWGSVLAATSDLPGESGAGSHDTQSDIIGLATGWDTEAASGHRLGIALGAGTTNWSLDGTSGSGESTFLSLGAYGAQHVGDGYVSLAGSFAWHSMSTERSASLADTQKLTADFDATSLSGRAEIGHRFGAAETVGVIPYGALQGQAVFMPDYVEHAATGDSSYALAYDSGTASALRGELGVRLDAELGATARLLGRLAWAHDWASDPTIDASFTALPGAAFTVSGAQSPENIALASLGLEAALTGSASLAAGIEGEFGEDYTSIAGTVALRLSW